MPTNIATYRETAQVVREAFNKKSLAALHIDVQKYFDHTCFKNVDIVAKAIEKAGLQNIWVVGLLGYNDRQIKAEELPPPPSPLSLSKKVSLGKNPLIFCKSEPNAMTISVLRQYIRESAFDTFLVDGQRPWACVKMSAAGLAKEFPDKNVIIVHDAAGIGTNPSGTFSDVPEITEMLWHINQEVNIAAPDNSGTLGHISTKDAVSILKSSPQ